MPKECQCPCQPKKSILTRNYMFLKCKCARYLTISFADGQIGLGIAQTSKELWV